MEDFPVARAILALSGLTLQKLGLRTLMDVIPLDAPLVRGSHGGLTNKPKTAR
jgi:hypothetical protein